jgi:phosphoglycolate phosphatase-like HAD superfamily hydrolase
MIGDTPYDVEAARRARVPAIALRCGGWWKDDDLRDALAIYDDPEDLRVNFATSPLSVRA